MIKRNWIHSIRPAVAAVGVITLLALAAFGQAPQQSASAPSPQPEVAAVAPAAKKPGVVRLGVVLPITQIGADAGTALNEAIRQLLISYFNGPVAEAVPLDSRLPVQAELEAKQKACDFVFYSAVSRRQRSSRIARIMKVATPAVSVIPGTGATTTTTAAGATATTTTTTTTSDQVLKAAQVFSGTVKANEEISVEFKLTAQGNATPKLAQVLKVKAKKDGEQVLSTLLANVANEVLQAALQK